MFGTVKSYIVLVALAFTLTLVTRSVSPVQSTGPQRAYCGAIAQSGNVCTEHRLLEWHGKALERSRDVATPLKWYLYVRSVQRGSEASQSVVVYVYDLQMRLASEVVAQDGKWHEVTFYPLNDTVFFVVDKDTEIQVWTP